MVFQGQAANHKKNKKTQVQNTKKTQTKHKYNCFILIQSVADPRVLTPVESQKSTSAPKVKLLNNSLNHFSPLPTYYDSFYGFWSTFSIQKTTQFFWLPSAFSLKIHLLNNTLQKPTKT